MESRILRVLVSLGVPGVSLGIFYLLFSSFQWEFAQVPEAWVAPIVILFMLIVGGITFYALTLWRPKDKAAEEAERRNIQKRQLKDRTRLVIQNIIHEMEVARAKALDDANKLTPAKCRNLTAVIQERIGLIEQRVRGIEDEAYLAIDDDNHGHLLDLSKSLDTAIRPMLIALADTVKDECAGGGFWSWVDWLVRNKSYAFGAGAIAALAEIARQLRAGPDEAQKPKPSEKAAQTRPPDQENSGPMPA